MKKCSTFLNMSELPEATQQRRETSAWRRCRSSSAVCSTVNQPQSNRACRIRSLEIGEDSMAQDADR